MNKKITLSLLLSLLLCVIFFQNMAAQSIDNLLSQLNQAKNANVRLELLEEIGLTYQKQNAHKKAVEYLEQAQNLQRTLRTPSQKQINTLQSLGLSHIQNKDWAKAETTFTTILNFQQELGQKREMVATLNRTADLYNKDNKTPQAIEQCQKALLINRELADAEGEANTYNNLGFLYRQMKKNNESDNAFGSALSIFNKLSKTDSPSKALMLTNAGVTQTYLGEFDKAATYYNSALQEAERRNDPLARANVYNYLAANNFVSEKNPQAIQNAQKAMDLAKGKTDGEEILMSSYKILAEVYQKEKDFAEYQKYNKLYQETKDRLAKQEINNQQQILQNQIDIEKKENEVKELISDNEKKELALKQAELEKLKAKQEIALGKQKQELLVSKVKNTQLEQTRTQQLLAISKSDAEASRQRQAVSLLEKDKELQNLSAQQKDAQQQLKDVEKAKEVEKLEKDKKFQELRAEEEAKFSNYLKWGGIIVGTLLSLVIASIAFSLLQNRKKNAQLARRNAEIEKQSIAILKQSEEIQEQSTSLQKQNDEIKMQSKAIALKNNQIQEKNKDLEQSTIEINEKNNELQAQAEELHQNQEEILAQRDFIERKNEELSMQNENIAQSINVARTIQNAILPYKRQMDGLLGEHFIIYRPKNVVSGDFYWMGVIGRKVFVAAVDCTGHGVPGAFMSLIGKTLLDKMIDMYKISNPAEILERMHWEIGNFLHQKESENKDGMDVALCMLEQENDHTTVTFSGAKRPLYYSESESNQVFILKGDRKAIGGDQNDVVPFTNQVVKLKKGSAIYLSSDGFIDQNDAERVKLGESRLKYTISSCTQKPMAEQEKVFNDLLDRHQTGTEQRDDILFFGIRL